MSDALLSVNKRKTSQSEKADSRQKANNAGGYTFTVDLETRFTRFLILGVDGNTYYQNAATLAKENAQVAFDMAEADPVRMAAIVKDVSVSGRAPKQNATLFSLAVLATVAPAQAKEIFNEVVRTGTQLFTFLNYVQNLRGWGRSLRETVAGWYTDRTADQVAFQAVKYRQRNGWTHRDVLRKAHPKTSNYELDGVFEWITQGTFYETLPDIICGYVRSTSENLTEDDYVTLVKEYKLSWEMLPDEARKYVRVWEAILDNGFPITALIRQLPTLTRLDFFKKKSNVTKVVKRITDKEALRKSRIHPINILIALKTYQEGKSVAGSARWTPVTKIVDALDDAFYLAFDNVEPTGQRYLIALDVSGSMDWNGSGWGYSQGRPSGTSILTPREASAAMAMILLATEDDVDVVGFTSSGGSWGRKANSADAVSPLDLSKKRRLDDVIRYLSNLPFGGTDCAAPTEYANKNGLEYDTVVVFTDNETWAGHLHPHESLKNYRNKTGIPTKLVVAAMTPTEFSIADPSDSGMLDISGMDSAVPQLITDFSAGRV